MGDLRHVDPCIYSTLFHCLLCIHYLTSFVLSFSLLLARQLSNMFKPPFHTKDFCNLLLCVLALRHCIHLLSSFDHELPRTLDTFVEALGGILDRVC
jgi:hypothetical protein